VAPGLFNRFERFRSFIPPALPVVADFGFPEFKDGSYILYDHGKISNLSETAFIFSMAAQIACFIGIILLATTLRLIQKQFGGKPGYYSIMDDSGFLDKLIIQIKNDLYIKLILIFDVIIFII